MQATAQAQPNIALIKYWGKSDVAANLPAVGSLSITLESLWTKMSVEFSSDATTDKLFLNDELNDQMLLRVSQCLDLVAGNERRFAVVRSHSNFPVAAGLASSASAFAALVLATEHALGGSRDTLALARLAGNASGSAARSLYEGFVELQCAGGQIDLQVLLPPSAWPLRVIVAITEEAAKPVGSGEAMLRSAATSPFYPGWVAQQENDLAEARTAVADRDFAKLAAITEHNCLKMHSVMWTSRPSIVYWSKATLACMQVVRELQVHGTPVFFTIDAGPQLKAVCLPEAEETVVAALRSAPGVIRTMVSGLGGGATILDGQ